MVRRRTWKRTVNVVRVKSLEWQDPPPPDPAPGTWHIAGVGNLIGKRQPGWAGKVPRAGLEQLEEYYRVQEQWKTPTSSHNRTTWLRPPQPLRKAKHRRHASSRRWDVSDNSTGRWDRKSHSQTWRPRCQDPLPTLKLSRLDLHDNTDALRKT